MDKVKEYKHIAQALEEELKRAYMISKYCNNFAGSLSQWNFITLTIHNS
jgi:hypothetical protein